MIKCNEIIAGMPFTIIVEFVYLDGVTPFPLIGYKLHAEVRKDKVRGDLIKRWEEADGVFVRDDLAGKITLTMPPEDTREFKFATGYTDIFLTRDDSDDLWLRSDTVELLLNRGVTE